MGQSGWSSRAGPSRAGAVRLLAYQAPLHISDFLRNCELLGRPLLLVASFIQRGDDGADYKETVILEKEEMFELKTGKPACLA